MSSLFIWARRLLLVGLGLLTVLCLVGAGYHWMATRQTERRYLPPGELVDVGGHRLHFHVQGSGGPTVVLEAPLGGASYNWGHVTNSLASFCRVFTYDRAGLGWSDPGPLPRTSDRIAEELHVLLGKARLRPPYVLVGYSMGGHHSRVFADKYPDEVAGLVLVDSNNPGAFPKEGLRPMPKLFSALYWTASLGSARLFAPIMVKDPTNNEPARRITIEMGSRTKAASTLYHEMLGFGQWVKAHAPLADLGSKPVVVVSRRIDESDTVGEAGKRNLSWRDQQQGLLSLSKNTRKITAASKLHTFPLYEPQLIVDAISGMAQGMGASRPKDAESSAP